jgi:pSer/pThr/pTyr-binding forkhead associated (FHA) protein
MARVEIVAGPGAGKSFTFKDEVVLGRSSRNAIPLFEESVSRRHARIIRHGTSFVIEDLGSTNGTMLGQRRLAPGTPYELDDGNEIRIGSVRLVFSTKESKESHYDPGQGFFNTVTGHPRLFLALSLLVAACFAASLPW